jgi:sigma-B regulation protein RsbU (phosphoserine phosphatase)
VAAADLFDMYRAFLRKELRLTRMALFVRNSSNDQQWLIAAAIGLEDIEVPRINFGEEMQRFTRSGLIDNEPEGSFFANFVHVVPVLHKERPIAYILIGEFEEEEDMFERVQSITTITNVIAVAI